MVYMYYYSVYFKWEWRNSTCRSQQARMVQ